MHDEENDDQYTYVDIDLAENELIETVEGVMEIMPSDADGSITEELPVLTAIDDVFMENAKEVLTEDTALREAYERGEDLEESVENDLMEEITHSLEENSFIEVAAAAEETVKGRIPRWLIILSSSLGVLLLAVVLLAATGAGKKLLVHFAAGYIEGKVNYDDGSGQELEDPVDDIDIAKEDLDQQDLPVMNEGDLNQDTEDIALQDTLDVVNVLLLGEEAIDTGGARGRTDLIMIASVNTVNQTSVITSLMRDTYVTIPGHQGNKLNAAYQIGGIQLLYETIEQNFKIKLDGYCLIGFEDFEKIIDELGGLTLTLSSAEASYLCEENYISNPAYRTVRAGEQLMNGNQVLGYARIRHVATATEANDFGRTQRHRIVVNAIFEKVKKMSYLDLLQLMNEVLPMITTDFDKDEIAKFLEIGLELELGMVKELRIPAEGMYTEGIIRQLQVLVPELTDNINLMYNTIYGAAGQTQ